MDRINVRVEKVGKRKWMLLEPFKGVPKGFITDGATVPRVFWIIFDPAGELFEASIVHDYMYVMAIKTKKEADKALYRTALEYGVKPWKAKLAYLAVKFLGRGMYGKQKTLV